MKAQTIFNKVVKHLFAQGRGAEADDHSPAYRGTRGRTCAVGHLIPERLYDPLMEGKTYNQLVIAAGRGNTMTARSLAGVADKCAGIVQYLGEENTDLLTDLQILHDAMALAFPKGWGKTKAGRATLRADLRAVAAKYSLKTTYCPELAQ